MNTQKATPVTVNHLLGAIAGILLMFAVLLTAELMKRPSPQAKSNQSVTKEVLVKARKAKPKGSRIMKLKPKK
ncbi:hypothetical protein BKI52_31030 [marine bacterium AO1-C]|nr:hypothetical protein BKI52_31030 [marine bacterium AO1-C]